MKHIRYTLKQIILKVHDAEAMPVVNRHADCPPAGIRN